MFFTYKNKLIILFSAIVLGTIAGGVTTYLNHQCMNVSNNMVSHTISVLYESEKVFSLTQDIALAERGYVITGDTTYLRSFSEKIRRTYSSVSILGNLVKDNTIQELRIDSLKKFVFDKINLSKKNIELRRSRGIKATQEAILGMENQQYQGFNGADPS
jgi:CHASE3 domain sensor protein